MEKQLLIATLVIVAIVIGYLLYRHYGSEGLLLSPHVTDIRQWPYYYYTLPYRYESGGAWPPGMYNRLAQWQPGYDVTGWSYDMRPGFGFKNWPRNRWVKNDGRHYYINNGGEKDRISDYYHAS
jgi:hypothetical protein